MRQLEFGIVFIHHVPEPLLHATFKTVHAIDTKR